MPINPGVTTPIFLGSLAATSLVGMSIPQLATGLALGLFQYSQTGLIVTSIDAGTLGAGTGLCPTIILNEQVLFTAISSSLLGHGVTGMLMPALANGAALGISASFALAIVQTINPVVGVGTGKLQLVPNGAGSVIFPAAFLAMGLTGTMSAVVASAIGLGIDSVISTAIGVIPIVGTPSMIPSSGVGV